MTLFRSTPLRADRSHDWEDINGDWPVTIWKCKRCGEEVRYTADELPDWNNCPGLSRSGGLSRSRNSGLSRNSRLSSVSDTNSGREHQKDEALREHVRRLPCVVCGDRPCDPAHVKNWGAGYGDWLEVDGERVGNLVALCRVHHDLSENAVGWGPERFEREFEVDLAAEARAVGEAFLGGS